ncbi:MAG: hypothetical protein Q9M31_05055 [Mariprofundus sp.]|nr:hypothetical protein [Mariprofundus sp.]
MMLRRVSVFLCCLFLCCSYANATTLSPTELKADLKSEIRVIVNGGKFVDAGEFDKSNQLLSVAVGRYPKSDGVVALFGKSLYESGQKDKAEKYFMRALRLNAANIMAQQYIEQIRQVRTLTISEDAQEWAAVLKDKIGDLIVFVISIWLGTSLNSMWAIFMRKRRWKKAKKCYLSKDYDDVVRVLESHVVDLEQDAINNCLRFMLASGHDAKRVDDILEKYVIRPDDLLVLRRSLQLLTQEKEEN